MQKLWNSKMDDIEALDDMKEFIIIKEYKRNIEQVLNEELKVVKKKKLKEKRKYYPLPLTPEEHRLRKREYRLEHKLKATPEELKAERLKANEYYRRSRQIKREKDEAIKRKAAELLSQNKCQEFMSDEDKEILRQAEKIESERLKKRAKINQKHAEQRKNCKLTPEEKETIRLKANIRCKKFRMKLLNESTPEQREARRLRGLEYNRNRRERKKATTQKTLDLDSENHKSSSEDVKNEHIIDDIEARNIGSKGKRHHDTKRERDRINALRKAESKMPKNIIGWFKTKDQIPSNIPIVVDEVNIEKAELQETTIQTVPSLQNAKSVTSTEEEAFQDSFWPWYEPSIESFNTYETSESHLGYSRSFNFQDNILNNKNRSTKIERRKKSLETSLNCMRDLIEVKAKGDRFAVFGKYIAQKLTTSKRHEEEVRIAKILIDKVLEEWALGIQSSDTFCIN